MPANGQTSSSTEQKPRSDPKKMTTNPKTVNTGQTQKSTSDNSNQTASTQILRGSLRASQSQLIQNIELEKHQNQKELIVPFHKPR
ncbi:hypothetical protein BGAL_0075g00170 [Botrytis galanthina]|uniref:Uncharacterized protein n=1 Tax=Botrytis galanthina TaxID=278940 RepID=A0A4S8R625_9HELO|nr:hypothetical protein BGAL_0075g00170 [Botrytis galanthina]